MLLGVTASANAQQEWRIFPQPPTVHESYRAAYELIDGWKNNGKTIEVRHLKRDQVLDTTEASVVHTLVERDNSTEKPYAFYLILHHPIMAKDTEWDNVYLDPEDARLSLTTKASYLPITWIIDNNVIHAYLGKWEELEIKAQ